MDTLVIPMITGTIKDNTQVLVDLDSNDNLLFETGNTYSDFKKFYESCAEK